jgi:hypothetical protein
MQLPVEASKCSLNQVGQRASRRCRYWLCMYAELMSGTLATVCCKRLGRAVRDGCIAASHQSHKHYTCLHMPPYMALAGSAAVSSGTACKHVLPAIPFDALPVTCMGHELSLYADFKCIPSDVVVLSRPKMLIRPRDVRSAKVSTPVPSRF